MKINFENGKKIAQIEDDKIIEYVKATVRYYKGSLIKRELSVFSESFVSNLKKYLCWYLSENFSITINDIEVVLETDLEKFIKDPDYAKTTFEENFDIIPEMGFGFWRIPFEIFFDEENIDFLFNEVQKFLEGK